jgi:hypothetical protein
MPKLKANSIIYGDYAGRTRGVRTGLIHTGEIFDATEEQADSLEARGLAYRYYPPMVPRPEALQYQTKVITAEQPPVSLQLPMQQPIHPPLNAPRRK